MSNFVLESDVCKADLPNNTVSFFKLGDFGTNLKHLPSDVAAKDCRPLLDEDTMIEHMPVERIYGDASVLDYDLPWTGGGKRSIANLEGSSGFDQVCGLVSSTRHCYDGLAKEL